MNKGYQEVYVYSFQGGEILQFNTELWSRSLKVLEFHLNIKCRQDDNHMTNVTFTVLKFCIIEAQ